MKYWATGLNLFKYKLNAQCEQGQWSKTENPLLSENVTDIASTSC